MCLPNKILRFHLVAFELFETESKLLKITIYYASNKSTFLGVIYKI